MLLWTIVISGFKSLWANKMRSILAMLGIIIGVGAVIAMVALGTGFQQYLTARFTAPPLQTARLTQRLLPEHTLTASRSRPLVP